MFNLFQDFNLLNKEAITLITPTLYLSEPGTCYNTCWLTSMVFSRPQRKAVINDFLLWQVKIHVVENSAFQNPRAATCKPIKCESFNLKIAWKMTFFSFPGCQVLPFSHVPLCLIQIMQMPLSVWVRHTVAGCNVPLMYTHLPIIMKSSKQLCDTMFTKQQSWRNSGSLTPLSWGDWIWGPQW